MSDSEQQEQWTPGVLASDAKIGTDDPEQEAEQIEGQLTLDDADEPDGAGTDSTT